MLDMVCCTEKEQIKSVTDINVLINQSFIYIRDKNLMVVQNTEIMLNVKSLLLYKLVLFVFNFNNKMLPASFYECF